MDPIKKKQQAQLLALYRMILADGNVDPREITQIYRLGIEEFGLSQEEVREAIFTENYAVYVPETIVDKMVSLYQMATIAAADNEIDASERALLVSYIKAFNFEADKADAIADILFENALSGVTISDFKNNLNS